jgi:hypothetical protein
MILVALAAVVVLRLLDRIAQFMHTRRAGDALRDEERVRVSDEAPSLEEIAARLRARRYRVQSSLATFQVDSHWLTADRAPWAFVLSLMLHVGLLLAALGILANGMLGWDAPRQSIDAESATRLPDGNLTMALQAVDVEQGSATVLLPDEGQTLMLLLGQSLPLMWVRGLPVPCCLSMQLAEITPGFRISAVDAAGKPLTVTVSSYADPAREVLLTFRRDEPGRLIAIEQARMAVLVSESDGGRVQVYSLPSSTVLTDTLIRPSIVMSDTTLQFKPTTGAVVAAKYQPGDLALWPGAVLSLIGIFGTVLWPVQRLVVRHHGHWTEFYASGRGMRQVVKALVQQR